MSSELLSQASPAAEAASAFAVAVSHGATLTLALEAGNSEGEVGEAMEESWRVAVLPASSVPLVITL